MNEREQRIEKFWESRSDDEQARIEKESWAGAPRFQRSLAEKGGTLNAAVRKAVRDAFILRLLQASH
jgi:hypothetical protein